MQTSDAFGELLLALHRTGDGTEITERDDGLIEARPSSACVYFKSYDEWSIAEQSLLDLARGRVLDIGCGAGRACLELQARGQYVLGIDISPGAIRVCKERGVRRARVLSVENTARLAPARFDSVLMMGHNLALLGSRAKGRRILRALGQITTKSARLVGTTLDPNQNDDPVHRAYRRRNRHRGRLPGQIRVRIRYRQHVGRWVDLLFVSPRELRDLVIGTGWTVEETRNVGGPAKAMRCSLLRSPRTRPRRRPRRGSSRRARRCATSSRVSTSGRARCA